MLLLFPSYPFVNTLYYTFYFSLCDTLHVGMKRTLPVEWTEGIYVTRGLCRIYGTITNMCMYRCVCIYIHTHMITFTLTTLKNKIPTLFRVR